MITNGDGENAWWDVSGIYIYKSNVTIDNNLIKYNRLGICTVNTVHDLTICNNKFI
jgi:hypothetical protein